MKLKNLNLFLALLLSVLSASAQEMSIADFYLAETDLTANTAGTMMEDQNGNPCALIKVETIHDGFTFDVGTLGVRDTRRVGGELWVYVPFGVRKLLISHPKLGVIRDYPFPCPIEKGRTYILKLKASLGTRIYDSSKHQKVRLQLYPPQAHVEINGITLSGDENGLCVQELSYGLYEIMVFADNYHTHSRQIEVNDDSKDQVFSIGLKRAFGWLKVGGEGDERLFVDGNPVEMAVNRNVDLKSGHYKVRLEKPLHKPYHATIEIKDSLLTVLDPTFEVNYREQEFITETDVQFWVDGSKVAEGRRWTGKLEYGTHSIQCRKDGHRITERILEVTPEPMGPITLQSPEPIYGTLSVTSVPVNAEIYVDGALVGHSPASVPVIIGHRTVTLKHEGYNTETALVHIREGQICHVDTKLTDIVPVSISSSPNAKLSIDGNNVGKTPWNGNLVAGEYNVSLQASQYKDVYEKIKVDEHHSDFSFKMKRQYYYDYSMVISGTVSTTLNPLFEAGGFLGLYLDNFYIEGNMLFSVDAVENIYWNDLKNGVDPVPYSYKPRTIGGKIGYGIIAGTRVRLTPMAGLSVVKLKGETLREELSLNFDPSSCSAVAVNAGLRLSIALAPILELNIAPEYSYTIHKSELYKSLYEISPVIRNWTDGVRISVGLGIFL